MTDLKFPYPATPDALAVFFLRQSFVGLETYVNSLRAQAAVAEPPVAESLRRMAEGASHVLDSVRSTLDTHAPIKES